MPHQESAQRQHLRALVVDDDPSLLMAIRRYLSGWGYRVDCAAEREEAEALLATWPYAVLIADIRLTPGHGREGLELLGSLHDKCPWTKAIILTGDSSPGLVEETQRRGADIFLQKPVSLRELADAVDRLLAAECAS